MIPLDEQKAEPRTLENNLIGDYGKGNLYEAGWFQKDWSSGAWRVPAGHAKINSRLRLVSKDCKAQKYAFYLEALYYYTGATENTTKLGIPLSHYYYNIKKSWYDDTTSHPVIFVEPKRSTIDLVVEIAGTTDAQFINHTSAVKDFGGEIRVDQYGNRYVYLVLDGAKGTVWFSIQRGSSQQEDLKFASYIPSTELQSVKQIKRVPTFIDSDRYICVWPDLQAANGKRCRLFHMNKEPLRDVEFRDKGYQPGQSSCPGCNEFKSKTFLNWLNPTRWFSDGVEGFTQSLAVTTDIAIAVIMIILLSCLCRRCIWPLICSSKKLG